MVSPISLQLQPRRPTDRPTSVVNCLSATQLHQDAAPLHRKVRGAQHTFAYRRRGGRVAAAAVFELQRAVSKWAVRKYLKSKAIKSCHLFVSDKGQGFGCLPVCGWYSYSYRVTIINQHLERFQNLRMQWNHCTFISQVYLSNNH